MGNAIVLPYVVEFSEQAAQKKLAKLAIELEMGTAVESEQALAAKIVPRITALNKQLDIPAVANEIKGGDIPAIAKGARKEALMNYPAPRHMRLGECEDLLRKLLVT